MTRLLCTLCLTLLLATPHLRADVPATRPARQQLTYRNPIGVDLADPSCIRVGDTYYLYATSVPSLGYRVWTSKDLIRWSLHGFAFAKTHQSWGDDLFWAPCVIERNGKFYMFFSCRGVVDETTLRRSHRICVATSDSPLGPFTGDDKPLFDIGKATIDAEVFIDTDGKVYLYYSLDHSENGRSEIYVLPLSDDLLSVPADAKPILCTTPDQRWEGREWNEGACVFRHGDTYVMMYSARVFSDPLYAVGYATAKSPLGPWTKAKENPILKRTDDVSGPGHNSIVSSPDGEELFVVYHAHRNIEGGHRRELYIDRLTITPDPELGVRLQIIGPTRKPQPAPSGAAPPK